MGVLGEGKRRRKHEMDEQNMPIKGQRKGAVLGLRIELAHAPSTSIYYSSSGRILVGFSFDDN